MNSFQKIKLGIVCPMANECTTAERFVAAVLEQCKRYHFKNITLYVVLDHISTDGTLALLQTLEQSVPELRTIFAPENHCIVDAYMRGYHEAIQSNCDWILEIDAGFSHDPNDIPLFFDTMQQGYDCVFGTRFAKGGSFKKSSTNRYLLSKGGTLLTNFFIGTTLSDMTSGFELFQRDALMRILQQNIQSHGPFFQTEIKTFAHRLHIIDVPIHYQTGSHPVNKQSIIDAIRNLLRLFKLRLKHQL